ncbi:hypothetical protein COBT_003214, partial [Conglomerata obtusa]
SARLLISTSTGQDISEGDGTTSVALLAAMLVKEALSLDVHVLKVVRGYEMALECCLVRIEELVVNDDDWARCMVKTTLASKVLSCDLDKFAGICASAVNNLTSCDIESKDNCNNGCKDENNKLNSSENCNNKSSKNVIKNHANDNIPNNNNSNNNNAKKEISKSNITNNGNINNKAIENEKPIVDIKLINIIKCPGKLEDSFYVKDGFILDKDISIPEIINPRILVANTAMDYDKVKIFGAKVEVQSVGELKSIEEAEKVRMKEKVNRICYGSNYTINPDDNAIKGHKIKDVIINSAQQHHSNEINEENIDLSKLGNSKSIDKSDDGIKNQNIIHHNETINETTSKINDFNKKNTSYFDVFINRQIIYDFPKRLFKNNNVVPIEHADFDGVEKLSNILNAKIVSSFYNNVNESYIGSCEKIENIFIGEKRMIKFSGIKPGAGTIVLCGSSKDILEEAERSVHDALCVLRDERIVCGGGAVEVELANELVKLSSTIPDVEAEAVLAFSKALLELPKIIAENCGFDGEKIKAKLRAAHQKGEKYYGINVEKGDVCDMRNLKVYDSYKVKIRMLKAAVEAAQVLIKCDGIIKCKPRERTCQ